MEIEDISKAHGTWKEQAVKLDAEHASKDRQINELVRVHQCSAEPVDVMVGICTALPCQAAGLRGSELQGSRPELQACLALARWPHSDARTPWQCQCMHCLRR